MWEAGRIVVPLKMVFCINTDWMRLEKMLKLYEEDQWKQRLPNGRNKKRKKRKEKPSWEKYDEENIGEEGKEGGLA